MLLYVLVTISNYEYKYHFTEYSNIESLKITFYTVHHLHSTSANHFLYKTFIKYLFSPIIAILRLIGHHKQVFSFYSRTLNYSSYIFFISEIILKSCRTCYKEFCIICKIVLNMHSLLIKCTFQQHL